MNEDHPARKYYLHDGEQQTGPFLLEDLEQHTLTSTTMVWYKGLDDWQEAGRIDELLPVINHTQPHHVEDVPPPFKNTVSKTTPPPFQTKQPVAPVKSSSGAGRIGWIVGLLILAGLIIFAVQQFRSVAQAMNEEPVEPTYQEQILSIEEQEKATPRKFLKTGGTFKETVFTGKFRVDGTIANTATVARYKNVVIEVSFYDSKNKFLGSERHTIEDQFPAGSSKEFKLKLDPPKGADNCKWKAVSATAY